MAFRYIIDNKPERYWSDFHFWYVNGFHPDPKQKTEIVEEKAVGETRLSHSRSMGEGGGKRHSCNSWRK